MFCQSQITHMVMPGDTLYKMANDYGTTVSKIMTMNPHVNPYRLRVGSSIIVCPAGEKANPAKTINLSKKFDLSNQMRLAWEQHIYWTRMFLISSAERLSDQSDVTARLLQNPGDIAKIFEKYYGTDAAKEIQDLLTEHLQIGGDLITALRDGETEKSEDLKNQWYANADKMAEAFHEINPEYYSREDLKKMLYIHLGLTTQEVAMRLAKNYKADIQAFDKVEQEALFMADNFTEGIVKQLPEKFI